MIAGIFKRNHSSLEPRAFTENAIHVLSQFGNADRICKYVDDSVSLVEISRLKMREPSFSKELPSQIKEKEKIVILFWGLLTNRRELISRLNLTGYSHNTDKDIVFFAYLKWGEEILDHLLGDFSLVIYNTESHTLLCANDHMGVKPIYYYLDDQVFIFSSTVTFFHHIKTVPMNPRLEWAALYMLRSSRDFQETPYQNIKKLPPAHRIRITPGKIEKHRYFSFETSRQLTNISFNDCLEKYLEILKHAVDSRITTDYPIGCESSGGLDSSSVTSLAALSYSHGMHNIHAFGNAPLVKSPELILQVSQHYMLPNTYINCVIKLDDREDMMRSLDVIGYPREHGESTFRMNYYKICYEKNIRVLLSGFGGDEFTTNKNDSIAIRELISKGKYLHAYKATNGNAITSFLRVLKRVYEFKSQSQYELYQPYSALDYHWNQQSINPEIIDRYKIKEKCYSKRKNPNSYSNLNEYLIEEKFAPYVPTRLHECSLMANSYGVDYAWPLMDSSLIQFFFSVPTQFKIGKIKRYFHRKALEGIVPEKVLWYPTKDLGGLAINPREHFKELSLNEDLHPDLNLLIDEQDLRTKLKARKDATQKEQISAIAHQIVGINYLDSWLKKFHPTGANWC